MGTTDIGGAPGSEKLLDLRQVWAKIRRRQWWVLATILLILVLTLAAYLLAPRRFAATASVALDRQVTEVLTPQPSTDKQLPTDSPSVDTEVQVLTSPTLIGKVVDKLRLASNPHFGGTRDGVAVPPSQARHTAIKKLMSGLQVTRTGASYAISVRYSSPDPTLSASIVNSVVDEYVENQRVGQVSDRARETTLLRERVARLRSDVINAEAAVARYRAATNLIDVENDSTATQQEISALNTELATAQAESAAAHARLSAGASGNNASPVIGALRQQQAQLSAQLAELAGRYGERHPDLGRVKRQLNDVNASIKAETGRVQASLAADARVAAGRAGAIESSLSRATGHLLAGNNASVQLNELTRNADAARSLYQSLLARYQQALAGQGTERSNAYVIAHAMVPSAPTFPNSLVFAVTGIITALLAAAAVVLVLELLERGLQTRADVEGKVGVQVLATVPDLSTVPGASYSRDSQLGPPDYMIENEASVFSEAFRSIRTALHLGTPGRGITSLAVCSALPEEGKTTTAICLARSAALAGINTILIDCDLRRRASSRTMAAGTQRGLTDVLKGEATPDEVIVRDTPSGAWLLPQGDVKTDYDLITQPAMEQLIATLSHRFDLIVLDTAPVLALAEARAVAAMAEGTLLVTRWRRTPVHAVRLAVSLLSRAGARTVGVAMTRVNLREQARAGQGDEMVYYNQFKAYYA